jgi:hypothetical protein
MARIDSRKDTKSSRKSYEFKVFVQQEHLKEETK